MVFKKVAFCGLIFTLLTPLPEARAVPGFLSSSTSSVPVPVVEAAKRALEIWAPAGGYREHRRAEYAALESELKRQRPGDLRSEMHYKINLAELRDCRSRQVSICLLSELVSRGSGFVVNGSVLVSVRHTFSSRDESAPTGGGENGISNRLVSLSRLLARQLRLQSARAEAQRVLADFVASPLSHTIFLLSNQSGEIVFDSSLQPFSFMRYGALRELKGVQSVPGSDELKLQIDGDVGASEAMHFNGDPAWVLDDVVWIDLKINLPEVQQARSDCDPGQASYNIGYPAQTTTRQAIGYTDAQDMKLSISAGQHKGIGEALLLGREWVSNTQFLTRLRGRAALLNDADTSPGISGGLIVNARGEACGLIKGGMPAFDQYSFDPNLRAYLMYTVGIRIAPGVIN